MYYTHQNEFEQGVNRVSGVLKGVSGIYLYLPMDMRAFFRYPPGYTLPGDDTSWKHPRAPRPALIGSQQASSPPDPDS